MALTFGERRACRVSPTRPQLRSHARPGRAAGQILYIGDSDVDMQTAKKAGVTAIGALWGFRDRASLLEAAQTTSSSVPRPHSAA